MGSEKARAVGRRRKKKREPNRPAGTEVIVPTPPVGPRPEPAEPDPKLGESDPKLGEPKRKRLLAGALFVVGTTAIVLAVAGGQLGAIVRQPLGLWTRWITGEQLGGVRLWGWPLLAWGRLGKVLQFVAGLTVVLDLIGPDRLRAFGGRLRGQSWRRFADRVEGLVMASTAVILLSYYLLVFLIIFAGNFAARLGISLAWVFGPFGFAAAVLSLLGVGFLLLRKLRTVSEHKGGRGILRHADRLPFLLVGAIPIAVWVALSRGLLLPLVNGLAQLFDRTHPAHPLRWSAFVLFVVGFQFDLLAS